VSAEIKAMIGIGAILLLGLGLNAGACMTDWVTAKKVCKQLGYLDGHFEGDKLRCLVKESAQEWIVVGGK